ncbi:MAG: autotransporter outer membrane beta-barrel domain-containing protein [Pseudomonadota bacterium]
MEKLARFALVGWLLSTAGVSAQAQSLDLEIARLLEAENGTACLPLLDGDPISVLTGQLAVICTRDSSGSSSDVSSSTGATVSGAILKSLQERLEALDTADAQAGHGFFMNVRSDREDRDITDFADGYSSERESLQIGYDQNVGQWVIGGTYQLSRQDGDFRGGGDFERDAHQWTLFAERNLGTRSNLSFYVGQTAQDNEQQRIAVYQDFDGGILEAEFLGTPESDFEIDQNIAGIAFNHVWTQGNFNYGPVLALDYRDIETNAYTEFEAVDSGLALNFDADDRRSVLATIGLEAQISLDTQLGRLHLFQFVRWQVELEEDQRRLEASFVGDTRNRRFEYLSETPDDDFILFGLAANLDLGSGWQAVISYQQLAGHSFLENRTLQAGLRWDF